MTAILHGLDKASSLYSLVKRGDTPLKIGKKTLFTAENISALLNRLRDAAMAARSRIAQESNRSETRS